MGKRTRFSNPLGKEATVYQAEMFAIHSAVSKLTERNVKNMKITVYSDSQACLMALNMVQVRNKTTNKCIKSLDELGKSNCVRLVWVPGHRGIQGNEIADDLARKGSNGTSLGRSRCYPSLQNESR